MAAVEETTLEKGESPSGGPEQTLSILYTVCS